MADDAEIKEPHMTEILYRAEGGRGVTLLGLNSELTEIYHAASGLLLLLEELAVDLTDNGYEPARYLMARLTVGHALALIHRLLPGA
jgi:hypothetical protein